MVNSVETLGLRVESISPEPYMINVNVNTDIKIKFNSELNTSSIVGNFTILNDSNMVYTGINSFKDSSKFNQIQGSISYKDKSIIFTPKEPLKKDTRYLIYIRANGIKDILGNDMLIDYVEMFYTESLASLPGCNFISPVFGSIVEELPQFTWSNQNTRCYSFQMSKEPSFETLLCDELIRNTGAASEANSFYKPSLDLEEGLYYIRVRAINGSWGEVHQIFIKPNKEALVAMEDTYEGMLLVDANDEIEVIDMFPNESSCNVDTKVNIIYLKVRGLIEARNINFNECFVMGDLVDLDEEDSVQPHGNVQGKWNVVYDKDEDMTYIIFTPLELGGKNNAI